MLYMIPELASLRLNQLDCGTGINEHKQFLLDQVQCNCIDIYYWVFNLRKISQLNHS